MSHDNVSHDDFILTINNNQFVDEEGNSLPVLQVKSFEETDQVRIIKTNICLACDVSLLKLLFCFLRLFREEKKQQSRILKLKALKILKLGVQYLIFTIRANTHLIEKETN